MTDVVPVDTKETSVADTVARRIETAIRSKALAEWETEDGVVVEGYLADLAQAAATAHAVPKRVVGAAQLIRQDIYEAMDVLYGEIGGKDDTAEDVQATEKRIADDIRIVLDWVEQAAGVEQETS